MNYELVDGFLSKAASLPADVSPAKALEALQSWRQELLASNNTFIQSLLFATAK